MMHGEYVDTTNTISSAKTMYEANSEKLQPSICKNTAKCFLIRDEIAEYSQYDKSKKGVESQCYFPRAKS